ncbi:ABC transporter substrate-binding protein [Fulvimarina sp. 2208YS6-2-32]|uniref:ABC transporter substrate-binding protein n=1 Tax=Fulvimarina uroteuthidis TaxID=3098149 RepID=A0ABU5I458_9HYPH|nr:ABC transporter substrate-binding protein [Fulvimarina sp. 2208YS6-2-32]MDY8110165.1 ABC transporter substrate-binding protein [Fulvimarina sp. 2208YS6-2-32]
MITFRRLITSFLLAAGLGTGLAMGAEAKTLVFCSEGSPETISPPLAITGTAMDAARPMFNNLVEFARGSTELRPALAESWTISEDGLGYTFKLRPGVRFHSNEAFTPSRNFDASDVVFSLARQWKEDHPFHAVGGGQFDYFVDMGMPDLIAGIEAVDAMTVRITLTRPEAPFLADLALPFNAILSAEYADAMLAAGTPEKLDLEPIGTGPFAFADFRKNIAIRYRAFDAYWRGRQPIDTLVFSITPTPAARMTKLTAGECHVSAFPSPGDVAEIKRDPNLRLMSLSGFNIGYLAMNTERPPFDDVRVRRALNLAIDRKAILDEIFAGTGMAAKNPLPPVLWAYDDTVADIPYDPGEARRLFEEAGINEGLEADLWYMPVNRPYNPNGRRMAEMIAADLEPLGVRLDLKTADWDIYRQTLQDGETTLSLYGWTGDNGDPDNFMHTLLSCTAARKGGNNIARWCDRSFENLVTEAKVSADQSERKRLYDEAQAVFRDQLPWVPIAHSVFLAATRAEVKNFVMDPLGYYQFEGVDLE